MLKNEIKELINLIKQKLSNLTTLDDDNINEILEDVEGLLLFDKDGEEMDVYKKAKAKLVKLLFLSRPRQRLNRRRPTLNHSSHIVKVPSPHLLLV